MLPKRVTPNRARSRGLLAARVQPPKEILFEFERGLKACGYVLIRRLTEIREKFALVPAFVRIGGSPSN